VDWSLIFETAVTALFNAEAAIYALAAIGLNMHLGYTGLLNFGQAAFIAMGAYGMAISVTFYGWSLWVSLLVGVGAAVGLAFILGVPTLRLRADYLAIVTIAASEIIRLFARSVRYEYFAGGSSGLQNFSSDFYQLNPYSAGHRYGIGPIDFDYRRFWLLTVAWSLILIGSIFVWLLMHSPWGRVLRAIREDEDAVRSLGKNVYAYKMQSLVIGGVFGATGGFIYALANSSTQPDNFGTQITFLALIAVVLGGLARVGGPIVGAMLLFFFLQFADTGLRQGIRAGTIPSWLLQENQVGAVKFIMVGVGLMLLMIFRPQGLFGNRRELML